MEEIKNCINILLSGTKNMLKELFNKRTWKKQIANLLTFIRFLSSPAVLVLMILGFPIPAFITALVGASTDWFDGKIARKTNSVSRYGELLDQTVDKIFAIIGGISVSIYNPLFLLNILGEAVIATVNIRYQAKYQKMKIKSSMIAKIKQWPLFLAIALGFLSAAIPSLNIVTNSMIGIALATQIATVIHYSITNEKKGKELVTKELNRIEIESIEENKENSKSKELEQDYSKLSSITNKKEELIRLKDELTNTSKTYEKAKTYQKRKEQ